MQIPAIFVLNPISLIKLSITLKEDFKIPCVMVDETWARTSTSQKKKKLTITKTNC